MSRQSRKECTKYFTPASEMIVTSAAWTEAETWKRPRNKGENGASIAWKQDQNSICSCSLMESAPCDTQPRHRQPWEAGRCSCLALGNLSTSQSRSWQANFQTQFWIFQEHTWNAGLAPQVLHSWSRKHPLPLISFSWEACFVCPIPFFALP